MSDIEIEFSLVKHQNRSFVRDLSFNPILRVSNILIVYLQNFYRVSVLVVLLIQ